MLFPLISANFTLDDFSIQKVYETGSNINGWFKIGFENQSNESLIEDSLGNSINLNELINLNEEYEYNLSEGNISSEIQAISINFANFSTLSSEGNIIYNLSINNQTIFSENITILDKSSLVTNEINRKEVQLEELETILEEFSFFIRSSLNLALNISYIKEELENIKNESSTSSNSSELLERLELIEIPELITEAESAEQVLFVSKRNKIDLSFLQEIGGGNYTLGSEDAYKESILFWTQENLNPKITFKKISAFYDDEEMIVLTYAEIHINRRPSSKVFLVIDDLEGLLFQENYKSEQKGGYFFIEFSVVGNKVIMSTTEELELDSLPFFIAPSLTEISNLDIKEEIIDSDEERRISRGLIVFLVSLLLIIIFVVSYLVLKSWYDKKYENYLFKDKNQLYNLINYINMAKKNGTSGPEIEKNLRKAKWSNEQIRYVMRKYVGKGTGLWTPKIMGNKKKNI
jgi:hypothetical protein